MTGVQTCALPICIPGPYKPLVLADLTEAPTDIYSRIPSPATGEENHLTPPRDFNLMFQTSVGAMSDASAVAYLRPETAQVIHLSIDWLVVLISIILKIRM